jgi:hypothetical protein
MADIIKKVAYFAMDIPNKPGEGVRVLETLAGVGVNLLAFSGFPSGRKAQLDFIPEDLTVFKKAVKVAKIKTRPRKFGFLAQGVIGRVPWLACSKHWRPITLTLRPLTLCRLAQAATLPFSGSTPRM